MRAFTKPPLTFEQQADKFLSRGLIGDRDVMIRRLSTVNYYRLLGYSYPFRLVGSPNDQFAPGTHFETIWEDYVFDQKLRVHVMAATERFEVAARTQMAYHHAHRYGREAYALDPRSLPKMTPGPITDKRSHAAFVDRVGKNLFDGKDQTFLKHFNSNYNNAFPPIWVTVEVMSIGTTMQMYQGMHDRERELVADAFGLTSGVFESWLLMFQNIRNICAHHARLWNRSIAKIPQMPKMRTHPDWYHPHPIIGGTKMFTALSICAHVCRTLSAESTWVERMNALLAEHPNIALSEMGFPTRWRDSPLWQ